MYLRPVSRNRNVEINGMKIFETHYRVSCTCGVCLQMFSSRRLRLEAEEIRSKGGNVW